jgi:hypothetical protein
MSAGVVQVSRLGSLLNWGADIIGTLGAPLAGHHRSDAQTPRPFPPVPPPVSPDGTRDVLTGGNRGSVGATDLRQPDDHGHQPERLPA